MNPTKQSAMRIQSPAGNRRGAMMVFVSVLMVAFLATVVFSIDVAHMHLTRTQLRTATDAAAKAAAQELASTQDLAASRARAKSIARLNLVAGKPLLLTDGAIEFGRSVQNSRGQKFTFRTSAARINSVRIHGDRTQQSASGSVKLLFGGFFGTDDFQPQHDATATFLERDVVLVVDRSGSMVGRKATDLKTAIGIFTDTLADTPVQEVVGLASYSDQATEDVQRTRNLTAITAAIEAMEFAGLTSISRGMQAGAEIMRGRRDAHFVERTMIVMTDGNHNTPDTGRDPQNEAAALAAEGVFIHTITFGDEADIARMQEIASIGRGKHYHAAGGEQLIAIYREIALSLTTMITQ